MSVIGTLNRAYHNTKQSIMQDHGWAYDPFGKIVPTTYQAVARISNLTKYSALEGGTFCVALLEDSAYPPIDLILYANLPYPKLAIAGSEHFNGEHIVHDLGGTPKDPKALVFFDQINPPAIGSNTIETDVAWCYIAPLYKGEILMDPARVMSHPGFPQREGEGIYTYPYPPDVTRNFIYHPATKVDGIVQRTISSNIFVGQPQLDEDVIITEVWLGGNRRLSTLSEMFRVFHQYWTTPLAPGETMGWEPRERTSDRFAVQLIRVQLGGIDYEYNEVREHAQRNEGSYLNQQLTIQFKLARVAKPAKPQILVEGR